jgi:hypothetical protein
MHIEPPPFIKEPAGEPGDRSLKAGDPRSNVIQGADSVE